MATAVAERTNGSDTHHRGTVKRRLRWSEVVPFPGNAIYPKRLQQMEREWGGYVRELVGSPAICDNAARAFPELPPDALITLDGNHRRVLAERHNMLDDEFLADLYRGLDRAEMHRRRRGLNDRRTIKPAEKFIEMAQENRHGPEAALMREVEALGWKISHTQHEPHSFSCVRELMWIRGRDRAAVTLAIRTYEGAWGTKGTDADAKVIKGLGAFWARYPKADPDRLVTALAHTTPYEVYRAGRSQYEVLPFVRSSWDGVRYVIAQIYNNAKRAGKVPL